LSSQGNVLWNNFVLASLFPTNNSVQHASFQVTLNLGDNILQFDGSGLSDSYGISIANVQLYSVYNSTNLVKNGNFANPALGPNQWGYYQGGINSWYASNAEVGDCRVYNNAWAYSQCIELDSNVNNRYTQVISVDQATYASLLAN
jgi:hypothetical protein